MSDFAVTVTGIQRCPTCGELLDDFTTAQRGPDGIEYVHVACKCPEPDCWVEDDEIHCRPKSNERLPFVFDCLSCWESGGFGRYASREEAIAARRAHRLDGCKAAS